MNTLAAIIGWAIFGLFIGLIARLVVPGRQAMSMLATIVMGVLGSLMGGFVSWIFTGGPNEPFHAAGWFMSLIGATVLVWMYARSAEKRIGRMY